MTDPGPAGPVGRPEPGPDDRVSTLRGAGVDVDFRRVGRVIVVGCLAGLTVLVVILFVAAFHNNQQKTELRTQGVPVVVTVTGCQGLLGGSGSNAVGYTCRGSFTLDGRRYNEVLPGSTFHAPGAQIRALAVPSDPGLVAPVAAAEADQASDGVYVLPSVLLVVLVALVIGLLVIRRRRGRTGGPVDRPGDSASSTPHPAPSAGSG